jgi:hypothetical protein
MAAPCAQPSAEGVASTKRGIQGEGTA